MKRRLSFGETISVTSMLFGLFFGAGNLIFPVYMGQMAGRNAWQAAMGFLVTGVGLPLLGVAALGISRSSGVVELGQKVGKLYGILFSCALYLTIGPFFAIPRCATVSFEVGIMPVISGSAHVKLFLAVFSLLFFGAVLWFSLRPGGILTWVGKFLNPVFLLSLGILMITALVFPMGEVSSAAPQGAYVEQAFSSGILEGYNTMDALAALAFGIVVVNVIRGLGVEKPRDVAASTVKAGILSCAFMALIYIMITAAGAKSRGVYPVSANGGEALAVIAAHYFGRPGAVILAVTVIFACLKTAVGLITSCAETFHELLKNRLPYRVWVLIFCGMSFLIANLGLNAIIAYSLPVLMLLYPLAVTLILLSLGGRLFDNDCMVYRFVTGFTLIAAVADCLNALPDAVKHVLGLSGFLNAAAGMLPFFHLGLGWICPAFIGLAAGLIWRRSKNKRVEEKTG